MYIAVFKKGIWFPFIYIGSGTLSIMAKLTKFNVQAVSEFTASWTGFEVSSVDLLVASSAVSSANVANL